MSVSLLRRLTCGMFGSVVLLTAISGARAAATLDVPSIFYPTIQSAIDAASPSDTVLVADGTYSGAGNIDLDFGGKAITVTSVNGAASTIIDCQDNGNQHRGFYFHSGETSAAAVSGFTITNGNPPADLNGLHDGGGMDITNGSSPTITGCVLSSNPSEGIAVESGSAPVISGCAFTANRYGGLYTDSNGTPTVTDCIFTSNQNEGLVLTNGGATVTNCTFSDNGTAGLYLYESSPTVTNCSFTRNHHTALFAYHNCSPTVTDCIFWNDNAEISVNGNSTAALSYCDVQGGYAGTGNIAADPLYVSQTDLHVQSGTPCYRTGTATGAPATDLDGSTRPTPPSIGAYEAPPPPGRFDFDTDSHNDLLWFNGLTGETLVWNMADETVNTYGAPFAAVVRNHWAPVAVADVDGDKKPDILWQNTQNGKLLFWLTGNALGGQEFAYNTPFATVSDLHWKVASMVDFDGDGHPDILWQNSATGELLVWYMNGASVITYGPTFATVTNTDWKVAGTADFDGDGHPDILWENSANGKVLVWTMGGSDGTTVLTYGAPFAAVSNLNWHIVGTGDMDGDGHPDLLWQNVQNGNVLRWLTGGTGGTTVLSYGNALAAIPDPNWQIVGIH